MSALLGFYGLSLLDALNPSAIAVTLFLLLRGGRFRSRVLTYVGAIFATYLLLGVLIFVGLDGVLRLADNAVVQGIGYALAAIGGSAMLLYALFAPASRSGPKTPRLPEHLPLSAVFVTGVTITLAEFSTALPYLGAIGLLRGHTTDLTIAIPLLVSYNAIFVLPPLLLMLGYALFEDRVQPRMRRWLDKRRAKKDDTWLWILGVVGFFLARAGIVYYLDLWGVLHQG